MIYYTRHKNTDAPQCACADDALDWSTELKTSYRHHQHTDNPCCVCVNVASVYDRMNVAHMTGILALPTVYELMIPQAYLPTKCLLHTTNTHTHTHIYIYIYVYRYSMSCMCLCRFTVLSSL